MHKKLLLILIMIVLLSSFIIGCNNNEEKPEAYTYEEADNGLQDKLSEKEKEIAKLNNDIKNNINVINDLELDTQYLTEEINHYQEFIDSYLLSLSEDELIQLFLDEWVYSLYIESLDNKGDRIIVPENGIVNLNLSSFRIVLVQRQPETPLLQYYWEFFIKGSIDDYRSHINLIHDNNLSWVEGGSDGTVVNSKTYEISDLKNRTTVEFEITDILKSRLKLNTNIIKVNIK